MFLVNGPRALKVNPGYFKFISGINLSLANKFFLTISFILYNQNKISVNNITLVNGVLITKLLNIPFSSLFLINLDFLPSNSIHFDNNSVLPLLFYKTLGFMFSISFLHFKQ